MNIQYYKSAWGDIKNSPGWFGKFCLLALLNFIPIFGQIVTFGYLYGWAREIAWGTHAPMPAKIFSNDDGKFWRRGWFVFVLTLVFALVPQILSSVGQAMQGMGYGYSMQHHFAVDNPVLLGLGWVIALIAFLLAILCSVLAWIGNMRISIYDRLSAGFQLGKIWKMLRRDTNGILRIFGMNLLVSLIVGIILTIIITVLAFLFVFVGVAGLVNSGYSVESLQHLTDAQAVQLTLQFFASAGLVGFLALLVGSFACSLAMVYINALIIRAMGYWTMQFDVARWGGQDDPMPFEVVGAAQPFVSQQPYEYQQPYVNQQPYGSQQPYVGQQPPVNQDPYANQQPPINQDPYANQQPYAGTQPYAAQQQYVDPQPTVAFPTTPMDPVAEQQAPTAQVAETQPITDVADQASSVPPASEDDPFN